MIHWTYASQYLQTCFLSSGIVKRAVLLLERHRTVIENEYQCTVYMSDFVQKHQLIDEELKKERARGQVIKKRFVISDIVVVILIILFNSCVAYQ